eukprot:scaffold7710_cov63-Phaeocystis_antarctica.AAC.7
MTCRCRKDGSVIVSWEAVASSTQCVSTQCVSTQCVSARPGVRRSTVAAWDDCPAVRLGSMRRIMPMSESTIARRGATGTSCAHGLGSCAPRS